MGMSGLIVPLDVAPAALADDRPDATQIAIQQINAPATMVSQPPPLIHGPQPPIGVTLAAGPASSSALTVSASEAISSGWSLS